MTRSELVLSHPFCIGFFSPGCPARTSRGRRHLPKYTDCPLTPSKPQLETWLDQALENEVWAYSSDKKFKRQNSGSLPQFPRMEPHPLSLLMQNELKPDSPIRQKRINMGDAFIVLVTPENESQNTRDNFI